MTAKDQLQQIREALQPFSNMLPDNQDLKDVLAIKLQSFCRAAREALQILDAVQLPEVVTVEEYADRMLHKVVLDGQYSHCYGRDTAKEFPSGLIIQQEQAATPAREDEAEILEGKTVTAT